MNEYNNKIVIKPWGNEYLLWENSEVAIWHLTINPGHSTSLHCHPSKKTGLIMFGPAELHFLNDVNYLCAGDKRIIRNGMFHRTKNTNESHIELLEIETPNDKHDIIRLMDDYDRAGTPYSNDTIHKDTKTIPLIIDNDSLCIAYSISFVDIRDINDIQHLNKSDQIMGIMPIVVFNKYEVMGKADIVSQPTLLKLASQFGVEPCLAILIRTIT